MKYEKGSFITVPTSSIVGIGVGPQSLYMWLCSHANNDGECFPSRSTLAAKMGCSERALDGYLDELISLGLVIKEPRFNENKQTSNKYYLPLGVAKSARGVAESAPTPSQNLRTELNPVLTKQYSADKPRVEIVDEDEDKPTRAKTNTTHRKVFLLFGPNPQGWWYHKAQKDAARRLLEIEGVESLRLAMTFYKQNKDEPWCPKIHTPYDLEAKLPALRAFRDKE